MGALKARAFRLSSGAWAHDAGVRFGGKLTPGRRTPTLIAATAAMLAGLAAAAWAILSSDPSGSSRMNSAPAASTQSADGADPATSLPTGGPPGPIPGYLLIADRGNNRMILVDGRKRILWSYPPPGHRPAMPFQSDDDAFFAPGWRSIITNEEYQQTIQQIAFPTGRLLWHYGHVGVAGSTPGYLNTPDDAYLLSDGTRTVADIQNCRVLFLSPSGKVIRQIGTTAACGHDPPSLLGGPNGDTPLPDGGTLVTEIHGSWVDRFDGHGRLRWSVHAPVGYPSDAQPLHGGRILLADYSSPGQVVIMSKQGRVVWRYGPTSGPGELDHPSLALALPNGLIAVNDDYNDRVVLIDRSRRRIVWQYGHTNSPGAGPGYLDIPDGMDFLPASVVARRPAMERALRAPPRARGG